MKMHCKSRGFEIIKVSIFRILMESTVQGGRKSLSMAIIFERTYRKIDPDLEF